MNISISTGIFSRQIDVPVMQYYNTCSIFKLIAFFIIEMSARLYVRVVI